MNRKNYNLDDEIQMIAKKITEEIETASSHDITDTSFAKKILQLSDLHHTKKLLQEIEHDSEGKVCSIEKMAVIQALLLSTWLQRLYFIIRSFFMTLLGAIIAFVYVMYFGKIDIYLTALMGLIIFVVTLMVTRLFDSQIFRTTNRVVRWLGKYERFRDFIINHF
ncbi:MAG TPA: hypothetical protein VMT57_02000 [Candidatus Thermoplasmatota archaeon]|nr:hypothetical protein [Candidatus Thermoplasmatota archaeon]